MHDDGASAETLKQGELAIMSSVKGVWLARYVVGALIATSLAGCTTIGFWPERWVSADGAVLWQTQGGYRYSKSGFASVAGTDCQADRSGVYKCSDGTVSRLEPIDGPSRQMRFDRRTFYLGPL